VKDFHKVCEPVESLLLIRIRAAGWSVLTLSNSKIFIESLELQLV